ncbi:transcription antitermination factor NusB [Nemorincola caseinilytica]|uniref:Transcription antitermination protein NusB n=1 Tax=Nemorincola caseinilytica TaxID=2054315 RepID=A0ABP8NPL9_9BACT
MISRRNIRVKVMQTLYTLSSLENGAQGDIDAAASVLNNKLGQVLDLFTISVLYVARIAQYADVDARQRASRYLATSSDQNIDVRIATSSFVQLMMGNKSFNERIKNNKLERYIDEDLVKKVFGQLARSAEYSVYTDAAKHTPVADKAILQHIWEKEVLGSEDALSHFTDELPGWEDDNELIIMLMQNFFRGNPKVDFSRLLSAEKREYAHDLLKAVMERGEHCMELITPKLTNWDKERVAVIDMLLLRMGVCEFLYFPTIPTKVTINEYIDIAKQYSTPQSGQFVNGVLDNILKDLVKQDLVTKTDRNKD